MLRQYVCSYNINRSKPDQTTLIIFLSIRGTLLIEEWMVVQSNHQSTYNAVITIVYRSPGKLACRNIDSRPGTGWILRKAVCRSQLIIILGVRVLQ